MPKTAGRLLQLISLLHTRRFWRGEDLAEALGVTTRCVRRDAERLRELGYPVHSTAGVGGGYGLGAGKELPPLPLDDEEAIAVAVALREAAAGPVAGVEEAAVRALAKLEQVLPKRLRRRVQALQAVSVSLGDALPRLDAEVLSTVASACRESLELKFGYRNQRPAWSEPAQDEVEDGPGTEAGMRRRRVEPYRLVHTRLRWYLVAWDLEREAWRTFRVDRMEPRPLLGRPFSPRALPAEDLAAWVSHSVSTEVYRHRAKITLYASAAEAQRSLSAIAVRIEPIGPDRCLVHTGADSLDALAFHLGYLGFDFEVHEPPELRAHLLKLATRLSRAAEAPHPEAPPAGTEGAVEAEDAPDLPEALARAGGA